MHSPTVTDDEQSSGSTRQDPPAGRRAHRMPHGRSRGAAQLEEFERYVERRSWALLRTAYLLTGDRQHAEELVQTALARAWLAWPRIREPAAVDAHVRRSLVDAHRSSWRRRRVQEVFTGTGREPGSAGVGETSDLHDALWAGLAELPRQLRATLVLRYYEDLSEPEIARALGVSVDTVESNASRGLARLRERAATAHDPLSRLERQDPRLADVPARGDARLVPGAIGYDDRSSAPADVHCQVLTAHGSRDRAAPTAPATSSRRPSSTGPS